jgi:integrase
VFANAAGAPLHHANILHALKRVCDQLGIPYVGMHGLRHLNASLLFDQCVPVTAVSAHLGHANPGVTMSVYAHEMTRREKDQTVEAIGRALRTRSE